MKLTNSLGDRIRRRIIPHHVVGVTALLVIAAVRARGETQADQFLPMSSDLVPLYSADGQALLRDCNNWDALMELIQFYSPQRDLTTCSIATSAMVLNALNIKRPSSGPYGEFHFYCYENFFTPEVEKVVPKAKVEREGMTLQQLASALATYPIDVEILFAENSSKSMFEEALVSAYLKPRRNRGADDSPNLRRFVVLNYLRSTLGQKTGGHISAVGAYHVKKKRILVMDTASYKYPFTWISLDAMWEAMSASVDSESQRSRGYLIVSEKIDE